tara:strand:+ start:269 stop:595 length:327 start_codon:yes stop_codon:yes gene_type:complete
MKNQIIKKNVDFFNEFIKENFILENDYYIFNNIVFKKLEYENKVQEFLEKLKDYYFKNKHYYLERNPIKYNQFNTIIRQLCKNNDILFNSKIKYQSSKYNIEYYIYIK